MAETKKKTTATPATPEQKARKKAGRVLAFSQWRLDWRAENPEGTKEQRKEAWAKVRKSETKAALKGLKALEKGGFKVVSTEA